MVSDHARALSHLAGMNRAASVFAIVLAGCATDDKAVEPSGTNPPMLWLAMNTASSQMALVGEEPRPY